MGEKPPRVYTPEHIKNLLIEHTCGIWDKDHFIDQWPSIINTSGYDDAIVLGVYGGFTEVEKYPKSQGMRDFIIGVREAHPPTSVYKYSEGKLNVQNYYDSEIKKPQVIIDRSQIDNYNPLARTARKMMNAFLSYLSEPDTNTALVLCLPDNVFDYPDKNNWTPVTTWEFQLLLNYLNGINSSNGEFSKETRLPIYIVCGVNTD